jgi:uncharacterized repeat protein (TIGR01451 family)
VPVGTGVSDVIQVTSTAGQPGAIAWQLLGPVTPTASGSCSGVSWTGAAVAAQGSLPVSGDGQYVTPATALTTVGCYGYVDTLTGASYGGPVTTSAGAAGEVVLAAQSSVLAARLQIVKRVNTATAIVGRPLTYHLIVTNFGPGPAPDVTVTDTPDIKMRLGSVKTTQGTCTQTLPLTCSLGTILAGKKVTITVVATSLVAGGLINHAHVTTGGTNGAAPPTVLGSAPTRVVIPVTLTKTAAHPVVRAGRQDHFTITVGNPTGLTARHVTACDRLPAGLVFVSASVKTHLRKGQLCWTIASIPKHGRRVYTITVRALPGARGRMTNVVVVSGKGIVPKRATATLGVLPLPPRPTGVTG